MNSNWFLYLLFAAVLVYGGYKIMTGAPKTSGANAISSAESIVIAEAERAIRQEAFRSWEELKDDKLDPSTNYLPLNIAGVYGWQKEMQVIMTEAEAEKVPLINKPIQFNALIEYHEPANDDWGGVTPARYSLQPPAMAKNGPDGLFYTSSEIDIENLPASKRRFIEKNCEDFTSMTAYGSAFGCPVRIYGRLEYSRLEGAPGEKYGSIVLIADEIAIAPPNME